MKHCILILVVLVALVAIAGCGDKEETARNAPPPGPATTGMSPTTGAAPDESTPHMNAVNVDVDLTEFAIKFSSDTAKPGMIHFMVRNKGNAPHSFGIRGNGIDEALKGELGPGESEMMMATLKPGKYETYCPVGKHEEKGMKASFTVK